MSTETDISALEAKLAQIRGDKIDLEALEATLAKLPGLVVAYCEEGPDRPRVTGDLHSICYSPNGHDEPHVCVAYARGPDEQAARDHADAIVAAVNSVPALIAELKGYRAAEKVLEDFRNPDG